MSYLTNISENSYCYNLKYKITKPYDEFISSNINFELFAILEFIINSYMPFGSFLTKKPSSFNIIKSDKILNIKSDKILHIIKSDKIFCLLVPYSKITKQFNSDFLYSFIDVCKFIDERKNIKTYLMIDFSSSFEILKDKFILNYLPKFKTIKELYLKTKLSGKPIPYRMDKMIKHFKEESNKVIMEEYDAPF